MGDNARSSLSGRTFERDSSREMTKDRSREDGIPRWADVSNQFALRLRRDYVLKSSHFPVFSTVQYRQQTEKIKSVISVA